MIYFDHNATTPLSPAAREVWLREVDEAWQNPSSPYRASARVRNRLEERRERLARLLGAPPEEIVFTSGATEGNNAVMAYFGRRAESGRAVWLSPVEHPCVLESAAFHFGDRKAFLEVDGAGRVDPGRLDDRLRAELPALVSVLAANNETGVLQPVAEIAAVCRRRGVPFHCDAAQWFGKMPATEVGGCDFVTGSAHKFGGPKGTGFLRVPAGFNDFHGQLGGAQEGGRRAGTENAPAVAAMLAAMEEREAGDYADREERMARRSRFEADLAVAVPGVRVVGGETDRLWNTVSVILPRHANHRWVMKLDREGFAVSTGSACATGDEAPSHVLAAMGFDADEAKRAVRVSGGWETSGEDWRALAAAFGKVASEWETSGSDSSLTDVISI